jgi:hypothetical protein
MRRLASATVSRSPRIAVLLRAARPSYVSGRVVAVVVDAIERVALWPWTQIVQKRLETSQPAPTHPNAAAAVEIPVRSSGIRTAPRLALAHASYSRVRYPGRLWPCVVARWRVVSSRRQPQLRCRPVTRSIPRIVTTRRQEHRQRHASRFVPHGDVTVPLILRTTSRPNRRPTRSARCTSPFYAAPS